MARAMVDENQALTAALLAFWQQGYEAPPVIDLVVNRRAGLYKAFSSKHELFVTALRYYQQELRELSADAGATVLARGRRILHLAIKISAASPLPKGYFLLRAGSAFLPQDSKIQAVVDKSQQFLESLLVPCCERDSKQASCGTIPSQRRRRPFWIISWPTCT